MVGAPPLTSSNWNLQGGPLRRSGACRFHLPSRYGKGLRHPLTSIISGRPKWASVGQIGVTIQVTAFSANWTHAGL